MSQDTTTSGLLDLSEQVPTLDGEPSSVATNIDYPQSSLSYPHDEFLSQTDTGTIQERLSVAPVTQHHIGNSDGEFDYSALFGDGYP
jgi:hypothetical protein